MTFFQEWIDRLGADEEVHFHYQARRGNAPFFNHGSYRDVQLVLEVSGHTLMMYSDGVPSIPEGASVLQFPSAGPGDSHPLESIGYEKADGFYLAIDPRYIRFVSYNENTERWDHVDPEEDGPNPCQVLLDAINAERFFREWTPPTLEDIMQRTWLTNLKTSCSGRGLPSASSRSLWQTAGSVMHCLMSPAMSNGQKAPGKN
jgi:hypothetical protein